MSTDGQPARPWYWRVATMGVFALAAMLIVTSAVTAGGVDLRPNRSAEVIDLVRTKAERNRELAGDIKNLRAEIEQLSGGRDKPDLSSRLGAVGLAAGTTALSGPGVTVELTDAPLAVQPEGVEPDALVVHQQDIQAVMNALWAGGAEAMTVVGKRVSSRTGIKCVGNTVVVQGVPYAPPYRIAAIGDPDRLTAALNADPTVTLYRKYVAAYGLGYRVTSAAELQLPGYDGVLEPSFVVR